MWKHPRNSKQGTTRYLCEISTTLPNSNEETVIAVGDLLGDDLLGEDGVMCKTEPENAFVLPPNLQDKYPKPSELFKLVKGNKCTFERNDGSENSSGTIVLTDGGKGIRCTNLNKEYCNSSLAKEYCMNYSDGGLVIPFDVNNNTATDFNTNVPVPCFCNGNALMQCAQGTAWPVNETENAGCTVTLPQGSVSDDSNLDAPNSDSIFKSH